MKSKINKKMCLVAFVAICLTAIFVTVSFYQMNTKRTWRQLRDISMVFASEYGSLADIKMMSESVKKDYRITLIDTDGTVLYDSVVNASNLVNHADREEVVKAKKSGSATVIRTSKTIGKNTYYYALDLGQGKILRVSADNDTVMTTFLSVIPLIIGVAFCAFILCFLLSTHLTNGIVRPIEEMAEGKIEVPYEELQPFAQSIKERREIEKMKQEFTANVSHELKTPLTSISGYAELIKSGIAKDEDIKNFAGKIYSEAGRLIVLIGDIMQLSELEEPGLVCDFQPVHLKEIIEETAVSLEIQAQSREIEFKLHLSDETVFGDRKLLSEVVYNLCDNAIRYNKDKGMVSVFLESMEKGVLFSVEDTGIGIAEKNYENIFRRFYRVDKSRSKETGGTGLGLAIVKHIAELHEAVITVESEIGKGTKISLLFKNIKGE
ncbi:MAG: two-component sensor histidine kinase [Lachnospiraceae bacterium]|nr:two-component sensor histidine kinase [Lachnospiraceae bacterium]